MRQKFELYFQGKHPGTSLSGPTATDEWETFQAGYLEGMNTLLADFREYLGAFDPEVKEVPCQK
jgi:hypothetical protein